MSVDDQLLANVRRHMLNGRGGLACSAVALFVSEADGDGDLANGEPSLGADGQIGTPLEEIDRWDPIRKFPESLTVAILELAKRDALKRSGFQNYTVRFYFDDKNLHGATFRFALEGAAKKTLH